MAYEFKSTRRVEFSDTDMAGIVHFANYFRYMEFAEHEFYRSLGFSVHNDTGGRILSWPRLEARCTFIGPLYFDDLVETHLLIEKISAKTISYRVALRKIEGDRATVVARGALVVVCIEKELGEAMKSIPIPPEFAEKIETAPPELLEKEE